MSVIINGIYTKNGAVFADGPAAYADKCSFYSAELTQAVEECYATMLADGVLLEPIGYEWDQSTYTLLVVRLVTSPEAYRAAITFDPWQCIADSEAAGWTHRFMSAG